MSDVPGFVALRFLKPLEQGRHYVIMTLWKDKQSFNDWQHSKAYSSSHQPRGTKHGADKSIVNRKLSYNVRFDIDK